MTMPIDPAAFAKGAAASAPVAVPDRLAFAPVPVAHRNHGWTAARQRLFIQALAETGSVGEACDTAGVTPRSAYRLRLRAGAEGFDAAWRHALVIASHRLTTLAFERAIHGTPRKIRHRGEIVGEELVPSDRLLMYLLKHYDRARYGNLSGFIDHDVPDPAAEAQQALPGLLANLADDHGPIVADGQESFVILPEADPQ